MRKGYYWFWKKQFYSWRLLVMWTDLSFARRVIYCWRRIRCSIVFTNFRFTSTIFINFRFTSTDLRVNTSYYVPTSQMLWKSNKHTYISVQLLHHISVVHLKVESFTWNFNLLLQLHYENPLHQPFRTKLSMVKHILSSTYLMV